MSDIPQSRYFQLKDNFHGQPLGFDDDGNAQPLVEEGVNLAAFTMISFRDEAGTEQFEPVPTTEKLAIRPAQDIPAVAIVQARIIPDTRIIESRDPRVDEALLAFGKYEQIDPPKPKDLAAAVKATQDSRDRAKGFDEHGIEIDPARGGVAIPAPADPPPPPTAPEDGDNPGQDQE